MSEPLLDARDPAAFELVNPAGRSPFVLTCDHASCHIPASLAWLGLPEAERRRHIAWDLGVAELGRALSRRLDAFLILQNYSRLVIDANRPPGTPESIVTLSERTEIAGNQALSAAARAERERAVFWPYHERIEAELAARRTRAAPHALIALHSFTPVFKDAQRQWHAGILYGRDARLGQPMLSYLRRDAQLVVGDNEPYAVSDDTDYTVVRHAEQRGLPYVEIEVRQDLLADAAGCEAWAERLQHALEHAWPTLAT